jgi:3-hydroxybutyryl-CoA dehydratase
MKIGRSINEYRIGQSAEFTRSFTEAETALMGNLIGDHNPFHYNGEFVRKSRFLSPIVHGWLVGGVICHFGGDLFPGPGIIAEKIETSFLKPVYFDEPIHFVCTVTEIDPKRKRVTFCMDCYNMHGEIVVKGKCIGIPTQIDVSDDTKYPITEPIENFIKK